MKRTLGICAAIGLFAACGSTDDVEGGGKSVPIDEVPAAYADATCKVSRACFGAVLDLFLPGENCEENTEAAIGDELGRIKQAITDGKVRYDGAKMQACLDAISSQGCVDGPEPPECTAAIDGTVEIGQPCSMNTECKGADTYCKTGVTCPGECAKLEQAGGECERDGDCAPSLYCTEDTQQCAAPARENDACEGGSAPECGPGLICAGGDDTTPGTCRTIDDAFSVASGGSCLLEGAMFCKTDLRCTIDSFDPVAQTAVTKCAAPVASGAACKIAYPDVCPADEYCAVAPQALDGTCTAKPGNGQPCAARGSDAADICAPGTRCDGGSCRTLQHLGGQCQTDDACYSGNCEGGGCVSAGGCQ
jgi:hypothetical protein